jgi:hypothetical protein
VLILLSASLSLVHAGMRPNGKYSGVVIFDRWDTCLLLSGNYIMYISESTKEKLRPYAGEAVQIDATKVSQPVNPGDGLVLQYTLLGPAPEDPEGSILNTIDLEAVSAVAERNRPDFDVTLRNAGDDPATIHPGIIGPTLLGLTTDMPFAASAGKSVAWFTRIDLGPNLPRNSQQRWTIEGHTTVSSFSIDPSCRWTDNFQLAPGQSAKCRIHFDVPAGEYQFLFGYGGGVHEFASEASNAISFDVDQTGAAHIVP